jgi:hypothetical protein
MAKGRQRTQKWYLRNEKEVMNDLGLKETKGSGGGWIEKEDGQNDFVIAQLKSTDKESYKLNKLDIEKLEYNAMVTKKIPMFVIQFLRDDSRYALVAIEDIPKIAEYINTGEVTNVPDEDWGLEDTPKDRPQKKVISSGSKAREKFNKQKQEDWENRKWKR